MSARVFDDSQGCDSQPREITRQLLYPLIFALIQGILGSGPNVDAELCGKVELVAKKLNLLVEPSSKIAVAAPNDYAEVVDFTLGNLP